MLQLYYSTTGLPNYNNKAVNDDELGIGYPRPSGNPYLQSGSSGNGVRWLQAALNKANNAGLSEDGQFGSGTKTAVINFQKKYGLEADGIVGPSTINKLVECLKEKLTPIYAINLSVTSGTDKENTYFKWNNIPTAIKYGVRVYESNNWDNQVYANWNHTGFEDSLQFKSGNYMAQCMYRTSEDSDWVFSDMVYFEVIHAHSYGSWTTSKSATCIADGTKTRKCSICGKTESQTVSKTGHSYGSWITSKSATCTVDGLKTRTCSKCGNAESQTISKTGHSYTSEVIAPTCTEKGYTLHKCSTCGNSYKDTYVNTNSNHDYHITSETGYIIYTCRDCGYNYKEKAMAVDFKCDKISAYPGETITLNVYADTHGNKFRAIELKTNFDENVFEALDMSSLQIQGATLNYKYGIMVGAATEALTINKDKALYSLKLKVSENASPGNYDISLSGTNGHADVLFGTINEQKNGLSNRLGTINLNDVITIKCKHEYTSSINQEYTLYSCKNCSFNYKVTFEGDGTTESPYLITNKEDLFCLANLINNVDTATYFRTKHYKQTANIDLENEKWTPLGKFMIDGKTTVCYFDKGFVYDGGNHKIYNLNVNEEYGFAGFIGKLNFGTVKNLAVYGNVSSTTETGEGTGGIIGELGYVGTISNCSFNGDINSAKYSGGIVGSGWRGVNIINCYHNGIVYSKQYAGGIVGVLNDTDYENVIYSNIENCYHVGKVNGVETGGIIGKHTETGALNKNNALNITNCYFLDSSAEKGLGTGTIAKNESTALNSDSLKSLAKILGGTYRNNSHKNLNDGYPVFEWQLPTKIKGDMNNDGSIMIADVVMIQRYLTKKIDISLDQTIAADMNEDGSVNVFDMIMIKRTILEN